MKQKLVGLQTRRYLALLAGGVLFLWLACAVAATDSEHPELGEQEMLVPCATCHQEETPDVYDQWYDSVHGIAMVKCYQCHGTFEGLAVSPSIDNCATCHVAMTGKDHTEDKLCWECHAPHLFKAEK